MRKELAAYQGQEITVRAYFHRFGYKRNNTLSVLVEKVYYENDMLTEHSWIEYTDEFKNLDINSGDLISFNATVVQYEKKESTDYGLSNINNIKILSKCGREINISNILHFTFDVQPERDVWKEIKGDKRVFKHNADLEIQDDVTILPDDKIEIELYKIKENGFLEYAWKVERIGRWNKGAFFNPITYGQALVVYGFYQIYLPEEIYFAIKDYYFKFMFSKTDLVLPYKHEMQYYVKPDKFKNRKFINYNSLGEKIEDEKIIEERDLIFKNFKDYISKFTDQEIFDLIQKTYNTTIYVDLYLNERSPNYKNFEFLVTKTSNTFTSSDVTFKSKFLDNIQMLIKEKEN
jgi:hypothetical protein